MIDTKEKLFNEIFDYGALDAIVVEGYDGVGKGRLLNSLSEIFGVTPYRPDYNLWQLYDHRRIDRWKVSGFFWDVYSHFMKDKNIKGPPMLFDRGVISGAVYNGDITIAENYKTLLRDMRVLHILVCCKEEDYHRFSRMRTSNDVDIDFEWKRYLSYTARYRECLEAAGVDYITYYNVYDAKDAEKLSRTCAGCGHYNYGYCRHPDINSIVEFNQTRCELYNEEEVQDIDTEMQCV